MSMSGVQSYKLKIDIHVKILRRFSSLLVLIERNKHRKSSVSQIEICFKNNVCRLY